MKRFVIDKKKKEMMSFMAEKLLSISKDLRDKGEYSPSVDNVLSEYYGYGNDYDPSEFMAMLKVLADHEKGRLITKPTLFKQKFPQRMMEINEYPEKELLERKKKVKKFKVKRCYCKKK